MHLRTSGLELGLGGRQRGQGVQKQETSPPICQGPGGVGKWGGVPLGLEWLRIISKLDRVGEKMWGPRA